MDKNSKKRSRDSCEIPKKDQLLVNTKVFVANSRTSNLSSATSSPHSRPIQTKISKLTIYEPQPNSPAKFTVKSVHTRMNHDYQPEELAKKNINQSFKPRNINLKELHQDIAAEYEKKKLDRNSDCENIKSLLNEIKHNNFESNFNIEESNEILRTPPNNIKTDNSQSHRSNRVDKPSFKSKQILSAIAAEIEDQNLINSNKNNLKTPENLSTAETKNLLQNEMEYTKLETVLENTYQNKINYGKQNKQFGLTKPNENNELSRSKTDILVTERSDFMQISPPKTVRSQSSINLNSDCNTDRKKSYNPEEARRFMQEQKKKRKLTSIQNAMGEPGKNPNDKEAIKKRLEDLRKHSLKILQRSVKIAKKKDPTPQQQYLEMPSTSGTRNINGQMVMTKATNQREEEKILRPQNCKAPPPPPPVQHSSRIHKSNTLEIKDSKIGLLRKESDDNSFSALNDKENIVLNTPRSNPTTEILQKITDTLNRKGSQENNLPNNEVGRLPMQLEKNDNEKDQQNVLNIDTQHPMEYSNMYDSLKSNPHNLSKPPTSEVIDLKIPDAKLNSKILLNEKSVQCDSKERQFSKQNSLPYWLKPSPIQIYPYNFIMAVRKKLEAITNPTLATNDHYTPVTTENNPKNTPVSYQPKSKSQVRRRIVSNKAEDNERSRDSSYSQKSELYSSEGSKTSQQKIKNNELLECVISAPAVINERPLHEKKNYKFSKSSTDTTSNFSSMSIHIPKTKKTASNNMLSSTKIDGKTDDTTISSSVFSSPEKKTVQKGKARMDKNKELSENPVSPLSTENISNLKIKSKYLSDGINMDRGDNIASNNIHNNPMNEVDFNQFLNDFNQSLSQVIEVNQQLKVTLDKSNQIFNQNQQIAKKNHMKTDEYTSDFEEETIGTAGNTVDSNNFESTATNHSNIPGSTIEKADAESLQKDQSTEKVSQSNNHDRIKNLERHSTDSEIVEIITSDTLSRTISVSLKSSKDFTQALKNEISDRSNGTIKNKNGSNLNTIARDMKSSNLSSSSSGSDNHSIKIIHHKEIENYSTKSDLVESETNNLSQNKDLDNLDAQHSIDMIPEKLDKNQTSAVEDNIQRKYEDKDAKKKIINTSASSEFVAVFNQSDFDFAQHSESNLSESTLNYSSIGLYEQLLQNENRKTEQLAAFLRMREKVILDRAKGQIAWLEVQREKIRSKKNLNSEETSQLIALKKRQRGILLKMEREREEIQKLLQNQIEPQSSQARPTKQLRSRPKLSDKISDVTIRKSVVTNNISNTSRMSTSIVRGFELQGDTQKLEEILKRREEELKKRREYAERLMEWHQRLDREEHEVLLIEKTLYNSNFNLISSEQPATSNLSKNDVKKIKKLKEIDKSLRKIQNISNENENHKEISGSRLNKLWNRLTGRNDEKFIPDKEYDINKYDLERLYEEAKEIVSHDFNNDEFLEQFRLNRSGNTSSESQLFKLNQTVYENNNAYLENALPGQKNNENNLIDKLADRTKSYTKQDKLRPSSDELALPEVSFEKTQDPSSENNEVTEYKSDAVLSNSIHNEINTELHSTSTESNPILESNEVPVEENQPSIDSLRPSVIVSLQKSQEDLCQTNETSNEIFDEISVETKISTESTNASQINSEDLGRINSAQSITSESGIFNNSYENIYDNSNLVEESNIEIEPTFASNEVNNSKKIETEPLEIISDISAKSSMESIRAVSVNSTDIPESINTKNTDQSSDFVRYDTEDRQIMLNNEDAEYENELFESDTLIEDISSPKFESTLEESRIQLNEHSKSLAEEILESAKLSSNDKETSNEDTTFSIQNKNQSELEKRLIDIDDSLKDLTDVFEHALSPDKSLSPPLVNSTGKLIKPPPLNDFNISSLKSNIPIRNFTSQSGEGSSISGASTQKMPDIISEVEVRRRQIFIENEMKQLEQTTIPFYFNREIPNKPPPPYHSPAHGSPMTIIFPSESRIKEITFKRTKELYNEITKNDHIDEASNAQDSTDNTKKSLILDENITNIYERIVLDICQEYINECKNTLIDLNPETYKNSLALFNPPDKLKCLQEYVYKYVRKSLGMNKLQQQTHQPQTLKNNSLYLMGKNNKRDNVDDILIEELYEEESKWLNFDIEEDQVKNAIVDEILNDIIKDVIEEIVDETMKEKQEKF